MEGLIAYHCIHAVVSLIAIVLVFVRLETSGTAYGDVGPVYKTKTARPLLPLTVEDYTLVGLLCDCVRPVHILRQVAMEEVAHIFDCPAHGSFRDAMHVSDEHVVGPSGEVAKG